MDIFGEGMEGGREEGRAGKEGMWFLLDFSSFFFFPVELFPDVLHFSPGWDESSNAHSVPVFYTNSSHLTLCFKISSHR